MKVDKQQTDRGSQESPSSKVSFPALEPYQRPIASPGAGPLRAMTHALHGATARAFDNGDVFFQVDRAAKYLGNFGPNQTALSWAPEGARYFAVATPSKVTIGSLPFVRGNSARGREIAALPGCSDIRFRPHCTQPPQLLALAPDGCSVQLHHVYDKTLPVVGTWSFPASVQRLAWSADGELFAAASTMGAAYVVADNTLVEVSSPGGSVRQLKWGPQNRELAVLSSKSLRIYDISSPSPPCILEIPVLSEDENVRDFAWVSPHHLAVAQKDRLVLVDKKDGVVGVTRLEKQETPIAAVESCFESAQLAVGVADGKTWRYHLKPVHTYRKPPLQAPGYGAGRR